MSTNLPRPNLKPLHTATVTSVYPGGSQVRNAADTSAAPVRLIQQGQVIQISEASYINDDLAWYQVGDNEYIADTTSFDWEPKTTTPPPTDTVQISKADLNQLKSLNAQEKAILDKYS